MSPNPSVRRRFDVRVVIVAGDMPAHRSRRPPTRHIPGEESVGKNRGRGRSPANAVWRHRQSQSDASVQGCGIHQCCSCTCFPPSWIPDYSMKWPELLMRRYHITPASHAQVGVSHKAPAFVSFDNYPIPGLGTEQTFPGHSRYGSCQASALVLHPPSTGKSTPPLLPLPFSYSYPGEAGTKVIIITKTSISAFRGAVPSFMPGWKSTTPLGGCPQTVAVTEFSSI
jgi:hypothetical protein